ncbi:uncharacterized protein LOC135198536 isoform X1 [Macrobrachium nipponense]|uniref:uncharacterized protein LOC135198536 isoform X1 n=1 Tax=Macrobrachium nipponense TaxID=159736 RepID=UPI0030C7ACD4
MGIIESAIIKLTGDVKSDVRAAANNRGNSATQRTISLVGNEKKKISHHTFTRQWLLPSDVLANDKEWKAVRLNPVSLRSLIRIRQEALCSCRDRIIEPTFR